MRLESGSLRYPFPDLESHVPSGDHMLSSISKDGDYITYKFECGSTITLRYSPEHMPSDELLNHLLNGTWVQVQQTSANNVSIRSLPHHR